MLSDDIGFKKSLAFRRVEIWKDEISLDFINIAR